MSTYADSMKFLRLGISQHFQKEVKNKHYFIIRKLFSFLVYFLNFFVSF